ncbi:CHAT domain-containing protein [Crucibulum laeve]|uniref:CHAT domain-containing protein n=1 Tax=Crucibulum laeve TaxID=68775 RepID=A0A5C3LN56_9AGAR|nr:CHAT domain-containing protein [Crucibulum laeve]
MSSDSNSIDNPGDVEDQEALELLECASSIVTASKADASVSNLENAIFLFREALDQCLPSHYLRSRLLKDLSGALGLSFMHGEKLNDLQDSLSLRAELADSHYDTPAGTTATSTDDDDEISQMIELAGVTLTEFRQSVVLSDLETAILLFENALVLSFSPNSTKRRSLAGLAGALFLKSCHSDDVRDITSAISHLREAVEICPTDDPTYLGLNRQLSCLLGEKYNRTSEFSDLDECLSRGRMQPTRKPDNSPPDISQLLYACQLCSEFQKSGNLDQLNTAIALFQEGISKLPALSDFSLAMLSTAASALHMRFEYAGDRKDLDKAIDVNQNLLPLLLPQHPLLCATINSLANTLSSRYDQDAKQEDLDTCIMLNEQALELRPTSDPERHTSFNNLANGLHTRYAVTGQRDDLEKAVQLHRQALALLPSPHPERSCSLHNLARVLSTRFDNSGDMKDLEEAITLNQRALELRPLPHPDRSSSLEGLASTLQKQYNLNASSEDLEYIILLYREALDLRPLHHPEHSSSLASLADALYTRYENLGARADLDDAISLHREAVRLQLPPHPLRMSFFRELASVLSSKFELDGKIEDLEEAISLNRTVLELQPPEHPSRDMCLNNLAIDLATRFNEQWQRKDLDEAISLHREALSLRPSPHPLRCTSLNNLAGVLNCRFNEDGQRRDVDEAIALLRQVLELRPPSHPLRSSILNNLGSLLRTRFVHHEHQRGDLDEAIILHQEALKLQPPPHPDRSQSLNSLALVLRRRFDEDNRRSDLEEAIMLHREALDLRPHPHPSRSGSLNNLAYLLGRRFDLDHQPTDLNEAIQLYQEALDLRPPGHAERFASLTNLGSSLRTLFDLNHQRGDLDLAISLHREALTLLSADHPQRSNSLATLGIALMTLFAEKSDRVNDELLDEAMTLFREATKAGSASPSRRFSLAKVWASMADEHSHSSVMDAYESSIEFLPQLAALSSNMQLRQKALTSGTAGLAQNAAACAIRRGELERAVEFLEAGRAVFWAQALQLRTPMDDLEAIYPELAGRLRNISLSLENASHEDRGTESMDNQAKIAIEAEFTHLRKLNDEWSTALNEVRQLSGFENFLKPRNFSDLRMAASDGPIITVVPDELATHILILTENGVECLSRPELPLSEVRKLVHLIHIATGMSNSFSSGQLPTNLGHIIMASPLLSTINVTPRNSQLKASERAGRPMKSANDLISMDKIFRIVLAALWDQIVKPIVEMLKLQKSDCPETLVRWCLTGPFTFLPMHAAGRYDFECASDYLISSYIPTISALLLNPSHSNSSPEPLKMLAVIQSETLPATKREMEMIEKHILPSCLTKLGIPGIPAGVEDVASHLSSASIAHFACHGIQNPFNPLESALLLDDGQLQISRIMKQHLPNASLAFLCACQTAMGDEKLPDEMISLAAALLYSGFSSVVGTMWSIADEDGPSVADAFYEGVLIEANTWIDTMKTAQALHIAVRRLRHKGVPFLRWIPFIHLSR